MATERPDAGKIYQPLPTREIRKENSAVPVIDVQLAQMSRQLTQLIDQSQQLNNQLNSLQERKTITKTPDLLQTKTGESAKNRFRSTKKYQTTETKFKNLRARRRSSSFFSSVFIFFGVIGIAAALFAAIILFFHGPTMI